MKTIANSSPKGKSASQQIDAIIREPGDWRGKKLSQLRALIKEADHDVVEDYRTSPLFNDAERGAIDYATELTKNKRGDPELFANMKKHYTDRELCEIVWLIASEHIYNMTNIGLNIHSDMLCDVRKKKRL